MKHCSRRLMALLLSAILCVQLLPAMARAEEGTAAASEGKGAFGLPAATGLTEGSTEYNSAVADAPFGSSGRAVPLFVKSELMLSYSWGGAPLYSHTYDYNGDGSKAGDLMGAFPNLANQYRVTFNSLPASAQASYRVAATDGVNTGSGRQEHIAMIGLSAAGIELTLRDRDNNAVCTSLVSSGNRSWINRLAFELGGFAAIACGDFDGDGVDSVVVYVPPTQGNGDAKLVEYTISGEGSSLTLTKSGEIGNVYELLGVSTLIADHIHELYELLSRIDWLITTLLKISRLDAGTVQFKQEQVSLEELLKKSCVTLLIPVELRGQELRIHADGAFRGDLSWTCEAIGNIVKNCMEHTLKGGRIEIDAAENALYSEIIIKDNGTGISPEDLPHIFERFYKGKDSDGKSFGIGLALSRMIITGQGGTVKAENRKPVGAMFTIRFYKGTV